MILAAMSFFGVGPLCHLHGKFDMLPSAEKHFADSDLLAGLGSSVDYEHEHVVTNNLKVEVM